MNFHKKTGFIIIPLLLITMFTSSCEKDDPFPSASSYYFPAGRSFLNTSDFSVSINRNKLEPEFLYDSCGGYWIKIDDTVIIKGDTLLLQIIRNKCDFSAFQELFNVNEQWVSPSYFIDYDNNELASKASELTEDLSSNVEKAKKLKQFIISYLNFTPIYRGSFRDKASKTYEIGYGTCINFSRLHVAMCRSVNIPARTIWGVVYGHNNDLVYDYHHQWAEIQDEDGFWHPMDFNYTTDFDLNDIRYLDLIYAAEENTIMKYHSVYNILNDSLHFENNYPFVSNARMGFNLQEDNRPESMSIKYQYIKK